MKLQRSTDLNINTHPHTISFGVTACGINCSGQTIITGDQSGKVQIIRNSGSEKLQISEQFVAHHEATDWRSSEEFTAAIRAIAVLTEEGDYNRFLTTNGHKLCLWGLKAQKELVQSFDCGLGFKRGPRSKRGPSHKKIAELPNCHVGGIISMDVSTNSERLLTTNGTEVTLWQLQRPEQQVLLAKEHSAFDLTLSRIDTSRLSLDDSQAPIETSEFQRSDWSAMPQFSSAHFHGTRDNCMAWGSKLATIDYMDLRFSNRLKPSLTLSAELHPDYIRRTMQRIGDFAFLNDGFSVVSRDFLSTYLWDMRNAAKPIARQLIFPQTIAHLYEVVEADQLQCLFPLKATAEGRIVTGGFGEYFHEIDMKQNDNIRHDLRIADRRRFDNPDADEFDVDVVTKAIATNGSAVAVVHGNHLSYYS